MKDSTLVNPLSDRAFSEWSQYGLTEEGFAAYEGWQEALQRATEKRDEDLESLHVYYRAEINRLRDALKNVLYADDETPEGCKAIREAVAVLEGKE